jgi:hypothetical protein
MKNLLMIAIALFTINATAQERKNEDQKGEMKERMEMRKAMTPEETAKLQTKKMTLHLDLTEKQQVEVEKLFLAEATERKAHMAELKEKREKSEGDKSSKEERLNMAHKGLDHQIEMKKKMKAILNADQFEKFEKMQGKRRSMDSNNSKMRKHKD